MTRGTADTYSTTRYKHGHTIRFDGGQGHGCIDVSYDGRNAIDVINMYDYELGLSDQRSPRDFERAVREYMGELTEHDANAFAANSQRS